jgi:hypothetical protein
MSDEVSTECQMVKIFEGQGRNAYVSLCQIKDSLFLIHTAAPARQHKIHDAPTRHASRCTSAAVLTWSAEVTLPQQSHI